MMYEFGGGSIFSTLIVSGLFFGITAIVVVAIVIVLRVSSKSNHRDGSNGVALNILNERYARGEMNDEEYNRKKAEIKKL